MSEDKPIWRPTGKPMERRKKWVDVEDGAGFWVWGLTTSDSLSIIERSAPTSALQGAGHVRAKAAQLQIMLSCYDSDQPGAKRIFGDSDVAAINEGSWEVFSQVIVAINEVNGQTATEEEVLRDFTAATRAPQPSA